VAAMISTLFFEVRLLFNKLPAFVKSRIGVILLAGRFQKYFKILGLS
jgi:hypothetical protein